MPRSIFGWSYPPGCSGPPEDDNICGESEDIWNILEAAEVDDKVINEVIDIVEALARKAAPRECPICEKRAARRRRQRQFDNET